MPRSAILQALVLVALLGAAGAARADDVDDAPPRRGRELLTLSDLTPEQRRLAEEAYGQVVCDCPNENWSKTLAMCPDGCAIPQKQEILTQVRSGRTIAQIVAFQVEHHGPKAAAAPGASRDGTWIVVGAVAAAAAIAGTLLARWSRSADRRRAEAPPPPEENEETAAVERELGELD